jgi:hypothetical protein
LSERNETHSNILTDLLPDEGVADKIDLPGEQTYTIGRLELKLV